MFKKKPYLTYGAKKCKDEAFAANVRYYKSSIRAKGIVMDLRRRLKTAKVDDYIAMADELDTLLDSISLMDIQHETALNMYNETLEQLE